MVTITLQVDKKLKSKLENLAQKMGLNLKKFINLKLKEFIEKESIEEINLLDIFINLQNDKNIPELTKKERQYIDIKEVNKNLKNFLKRNKRIEKKIKFIK